MEGESTNIEGDFRQLASRKVLQIEVPDHAFADYERKSKLPAPNSCPMGCLPH